jgi:gluconate kinase
MRDRFFALIVDKIRQLQQRHPHLVITQAVYKQQHRDYLLARIPAMELVCVSADDATILQRINRRSDGITIASAAALRADFEAPADGCRTIVNDSDAGAIVRQLNNHYGRFRPS